MVSTVAPPEPRGDFRPRRHRAALIGLIVGVALLATLVVLVVRDVADSSFDVPKFPSLAEHPDSSLHGTVAYLDGSSRCVWIVAAAGRPSKKVLCLPPMDVTKSVQTGTKETDPQLVWRPDGTLEITVFRASAGKGEPPSLHAGWQKVVDVQRGVVEDVQDADVPAAANLTTRPLVDPSGARITTSSDVASGRIKVQLSDSTGTRTLLAAHGPGRYTYALHAAFWAPNWQWIAADDGRILVITTGRVPRTRVLIDRTTGGGGMATGDARFSFFAVTGADLLRD